MLSQPTTDVSCLVGVQLEIDEYVRQIKNLSIRNYLILLSDKIKTIHARVNHILNLSHKKLTDWNYHQIVNQEERKTKKAVDELSHYLLELNSMLNTAPVDNNKSYHLLLENTRVAIENTYQKINRVIEGLPGKLNKNRFLVNIAHQYNGICLPRSQKLDPLNGNADGSCEGFALSYINAIHHNKKPDLSFSLNADVYKKQRENTLSYFFHYVKKNICGFHDVINEQSMQQLVKKIKNNSLYELVLQSAEGDHAITLRRIQNTGELEYVDSNIGYCLFKNDADLIIWFRYILMYYQAINFFFDKFNLVEVAKQKNNSALFSIPTPTKNCSLKLDDDNVFTDMVKQAYSYAKDDINKLNQFNQLLANFTDIGGLAFSRNDGVAKSA